jgi:uncharacterized protein YjiS (DUF1127 family)
MDNEDRGSGLPLFAGLLAGLSRLICASVVVPVKRHVCRRACKGALAQLNDHLLRDIGLTRSEVDAIAHGLLTLADAESRPATPEQSGAVRPRLRVITRWADTILGLFVRRGARR